MMKMRVGSQPMKRATAIGGAAAAAGLATLVGAPPVTANPVTIPVPNISVPALPATWSALGTGILASPDVPTGSVVLAGTEIKAQIGTIDFAGTSGQGTYTPTWLSCPSRGATDSACTPVDPGTSQPGNPSGQTRAYTPKAEDVGRYLRFSLSVTPPQGVPKLATSDPAKDVYVLGPAATGGQPEVKPGQVPGEHGIALLRKWAIPASSGLRSREVAAWACTSPSAGQSTTREFVPASAGCTSLQVLTSVSWVADATAIVFAIPADAAGKYLLVSDAVTTSTGPSLALATYLVRSAAVPLKGSAAGASASPAPSASPSPAPSGSAVGSQSGSQSGGQSTSATGTMSVTAERRATAGVQYEVKVAMTPASAAGVANVSLVTRGSPSQVVQTLSSVQVANGTGTSRSTITARPGRYALVVQFVDGTTGKSLTYTRKVRVRD